ncbi:hypothetical protein F9K96_07205 [Brucella anthropi]|uniref:hypothetical protein n=1 Tax=Brucella anthropi TaxID=529 RepID=UPI00124ED7D3|nr:hypothetical protein [Brucella anthropi]KAB2792903.1 hypothetical protein F9K96_07205 [Brucella anthropi]
MKRLVLIPDGWSAPYGEIRPGLFLANGEVCLKSEYGQEGYCDSGEAFARHELEVQPIKAVWEEYED